MTNETTEKLPPGIVLGPDGKPCKPCSDWRSWSTLKAKKPKDSTSGARAAATAGAATATATHTSSSTQDSRSECPADVEQLGRATWTFLHTTAAYYPEQPSPTQQASMLGLLSSLPTLYPCGHCASHLGENMQKNPPDVSGRGPLSKWLCIQHNDVNERLGKPTFNCDKTDERWLSGPSDGSCD